MKPANNYGNATFLTDFDADVAAFIRSYPVLHEAIGLCESYIKHQINPRARKYLPPDAVEISKRNFVKFARLEDCFEERPSHTGEPEYAPINPPCARYTVCMGEHEVFDRVLEEIREGMHYMTPHFVATYTAEGIDEEIIEVLQPLGHANIIYQMLQHPQEPTLRRLVDEAIQTDGAAHFLASYDGEEIEIPTSGETCYIYRRD
jgi:hypothetical protein